MLGFSKRLMRILNCLVISSDNRTLYFTSGTFGLAFFGYQLFRQTQDVLDRVSGGAKERVEPARNNGGMLSVEMTSMPPLL